MRRLGVALGGGGSRGVAHIGVMRALNEAGIRVHAVAGISAGALMAAGYCLNGPSAVLDAALNRPAAILALYRDRLRLAASNTIGRLLAEMAGDARIEDCTPALAICAADVHTREPIALREGPVLRALQATIAIPFIGDPVEIDGRYLADCGRDSYIMRQALREMGAEVILEVSLFPQVQSGAPRPVALLGQALVRQLEREPARPPRHRDLLRFAVDLAVRTPPPVPSADLLVVPRLPTIPSLARNGLQRARRAGYVAMRAALPQLQALLSGAPAPALAVAEA
jgi:NTE family protein